MLQYVCNIPCVDSGIVSISTLTEYYIFECAFALFLRLGIIHKLLLLSKQGLLNRINIFSVLSLECLEEAVFGGIQICLNFGSLFLKLCLNVFVK